jgi:ubiquinone/menaquinone biosynthesis C-methylase UbiE
MSGEVHGIDVDEVAIAKVRELVPNGIFVVGRAERLPYADRYFDRVTADVWIPCMDIPAVFLEVHRVLTEDGEFEFSYHTLLQVVGYFARAAARLHWRAVIFDTYVLRNGLYCHLSGRVRRFRYKKKYESFQTLSGLERALNRAGFMIVRTQGRQAGRGPRVAARKRQ